MSQDYQSEKIELSDNDLKLIRNIMVFIDNEHAMLNIFDDVWSFGSGIDKDEYKELLTKIKVYLDKK
ncbi:MAG: hypothetical protein L0H53_03815 [Candidatus Nitrosocosmicus sp.]|nr:hypothetical protein [Candidatus Nitrosocosmicus sp.]MDN5866247.1 hypothetical protein [Candidatus Nitrosocosmicus sp.]